jgi:hypothetical protein
MANAGDASGNWLDRIAGSFSGYIEYRRWESMAGLFVFDDGELQDPMNCQVLAQIVYSSFY